MSDQFEPVANGLKVPIGGAYRKLKAAQAGLEYWSFGCQDIIIEELGAFLPRVTDFNDHGVFHRSVGGIEACKRSRVIGRNKITRRTHQDILSGLAKMRERLSDSRLTPDARALIEHFRLPDPDKLPTCYRVYSSVLGPTLIVLWGFETNSSDSIPATQAIAKLAVEEWWRPWLRWLGLALAFLLLCLLLWMLFDLLNSLPHAQLNVTPSTVHVEEPVTFDASHSRGDRFVLKVGGVEHEITPQSMSFQDSYPSPGKIEATVTAFKTWHGFNLPPSEASGSVDVLAAPVKPVPPERVETILAPTPLFSTRVTSIPGDYPATVEFQSKTDGTVSVEDLVVKQDIHASNPLAVSNFNKPGQYSAMFNPKPGDSSADDVASKPQEAKVQLFPKNYVPGNPVANLSLSRDTLQPGENLHADAGRSFDPTDPNPQTSISWDGGSTFEPVGPNGSDHKFTDPGSKKVVLKVVNSKGKEDTSEATVQVTSPPPQPPAQSGAVAPIQALANRISQPTVVRFNSSVMFPIGSTALTVDGAKVLKQVQEAVVKQSLIVKVRGFTDSLPISGDLAQTYADNKALSEARAKAVADFLTDILGVDKASITYEGMGESDPIAPNTTEQGRGLNRRVEITLSPKTNNDQSAPHP